MFCDWPIGHCLEHISFIFVSGKAIWSSSLQQAYSFFRQIRMASDPKFWSQQELKPYPLTHEPSVLTARSQTLIMRWCFIYSDFRNSQWCRRVELCLSWSPRGSSLTPSRSAPVHPDRSCRSKSLIWWCLCSSAINIFLYLALDVTANCICEIQCLALGGFNLNTFHTPSNKEKKILVELGFDPRGAGWEQKCFLYAMQSPSSGKTIPRVSLNYP